MACKALALSQLTFFDPHLPVTHSLAVKLWTVPLPVYLMNLPQS